MVDAMLHNIILGVGWSCLEGGGGVGLGVFALLQRLCYNRGVKPSLATVWTMAGKNPFGREGNHGGPPPHQLGEDRGAGNSGAAEAEARGNGQEAEDPGERWFRQENSHAEIRTLTRLEDDLNSALLFKHGGGQRASELWITRILLGRLLWERTTLGKEVEVFAKLHRRDIMRSMVKLHDLVDLAEPPWRGMAEASSSGRPWEEAMDLDEAIEHWDTEVAKEPASPSEANLGLG